MWGEEGPGSGRRGTQNHAVFHTLNIAAVKRPHPYTTAPTLRSVGDLEAATRHLAGLLGCAHHTSGSPQLHQQYLDAFVATGEAQHGTPGGRHAAWNCKKRVWHCC